MKPARSLQHTCTCLSSVCVSEAVHTVIFCSGCVHSCLHRLLLCASVRKRCTPYCRPFAPRLYASVKFSKTKVASRQVYMYVYVCLNPSSFSQQLQLAGALQHTFICLPLAPYVSCELHLTSLMIICMHCCLQLLALLGCCFCLKLPSPLSCCFCPGALGKTL